MKQSSASQKTINGDAVNKELLFLKLFLFVSPFFIGGFHIAVSAVFVFVLLVFAVVRSFRRPDCSYFSLTVVSLSLLLIPVCYLAASVWAVDSGTAVYGFIKFLPVAAFVVAVNPYNSQQKNELFSVMPLGGVIMTALSFVMSLIPLTADFTLVADRLGGFFQYPNTFALYCLVGLIILMTSEKIKRIHWLYVAVLIFGIFRSGSRTVFVFLIVTALIIVFVQKNKKLKRNLLIIIGAGIATAVIIVIVTGKYQIFSRFLTISLDSSTFLGRLLYYTDALPVIFKHPFGLGYYGYYFLQGSFQTGVYSVAFIHNDALQLLLDTGWIPSVLFFVSVGMSFFSKKTDVRRRLLLLIVFGHSLLDFDLQFISIFFILILSLDFESMKIRVFKIPSLAVSGVTIPLVVLSLYFGIANAFFLTGNYEFVDRLYGFDSLSKVQLMTDNDNTSLVYSLADEVIKLNGNLAVAYDAKANEYYSEGDFEKVIQYKQKAIECSPYTLAEYDDFCRKLMVGISLYESAGDVNSVQYCQKELVAIKKKLKETEDKTSSLGRKIQDKPELTLSKEITDYIEGIENNE